MISVRARYLFRELYYSIIFQVARVISKIYEPVIRFNIRGVKMKLNLAHSLPYIVKINGYHDMPLPAFCKFYKSHKKDLFIIDAGANVGDTALLIDHEVAANILCIEPSVKFYNILKLNVSNKTNIKYTNSYLGESDEESFFSVDNIMGNGITRESGTINKFYSLDTLTKELEFHYANIIKTDTEGFDFKILRGAKDIIEKNSPALYFELHPYLLKANNEDINGFFDFLNQNGYTEFLAYNQSGFPLGIFSTSDNKAIEGLINFSLINIDCYFDVLTLSKSENKILIDFYNSEIKRFPVYKWF